MTAAERRPYRLLHKQPAPHRCDLPEPHVENDVIECLACGRVYVARWTDDSWGRPCWVRLRWWHRRAKRALRLSPYWKRTTASGPSQGQS